MTDDVSKRVAQIIAEQAMLDPQAIKPETTLEDLGLDSLAVVEVVFGIEEAFDISKVAHIVDGVKLLIAAKG